MKRLSYILLISLITTVLISISSFIQETDETFYYAYNNRIKLIPLKNKVVIKFKEPIEDASTLKGLINNSNLKSIDYEIVSFDQRTFFVTEKKPKKIENFKAEMKKLTQVRSIHPSYITHSGIKMDVTDEFVVRFLAETTEEQIAQLHAQYGVEIIKTTKLYQLLVVPSKADVLKVANSYQESRLVRYAHPNFISEIEFFQDIPNDAYFNKQFAPHNTGQTINDNHSGTVDADVDAPEAWDITKGSSNIIIAVIDEGVTSNHYDLPNSRQVRLDGSNFTDGDPDDPSPTGYQAHGNACAGIIAATQDNSQGVTGIAPNCKIMPIRIANWTNINVFADALTFAYENDADIISNSWGWSLDYLETHHSTFIPLMVDAIEEAVTDGRNGLGSIVVFAASNSAHHVDNDSGYVAFPACVNIAGVFTVGASDRNDDQSDYSPTSDPESDDNQIIDVVAPSHRAYPQPEGYEEHCIGIDGEAGEIYTIDIPGSYGYNPWPHNGFCDDPPLYGEELPGSGTNYLSYTGRFGGTSAACPLTAGIAALVLSIDPYLTQLQVFNIIACTADEVGGFTYTNGWSDEFGYGRVNAYQAVSLTDDLGDMYISGPSLVCSSPSQLFTLYNRPSQTTIEWDHSSNLIYYSGQGTNQYRVKATAYASGPGWVEATIFGDNEGEIATIKYSNFWVGVPDPTIDGPYYLNCDDIEWYFLDPEDQWGGTYYWSTTYHLSILGSPYGTKARIRADEEGEGGIFIDVSNTCGTGYESFPVWIDCWGFRMSPNPADDYVEISLDETKADLSNILEYEVKIYNNQQVLISNVKTRKPSLQFNTSQFKNGIYYVHLIYDGKPYVRQLVISH